MSVTAVAAEHADLVAQQVTTATIAGRVRGEQQEAVDGAVVRVVNRATGYALQTDSREGRFVFAGLPVGGPYSIVVERIGYRPAKRDSIFLALGEQLQLDFALLLFASTLDTLRVVAAEPRGQSFARYGIGTAISDSALHRLPTIDRDMYDFVRLTPQVSARSGSGSLSAGGVGVRFNNFLVDGVSERGLLGNFAAGTGQGAKAISIEAVKEYQVLLSPYDVRYGDFAGGLVNAVTRSGTNELHGTAFVYARGEELARGTEFLRERPYQRTQFGFAIGGPIARDRAHFFVATELQRLTSPASGPYVGQSVGSEVGLPVSEGDVTRFVEVLHGHGIEAGSAGPIEVGNPLVNFFGRIDVALPEWRSRLVLWNNYSRAENIVFTRGSSTSSLTRGAESFQLSSTGRTSTVAKEVAAAQLYT
ncbi:MAG: carboxypeptidase regulatory-like domain-containing protein, partial [Gammaproteobacteria bacterium]